MRICCLILVAACGNGAVQAVGGDDLTTPAVQHLVVLVQENHSFDNYFGLYCSGSAALPSGTGRSGCQQAPALVPGVDDYLFYSRNCHPYSSSSWLDDGYNDSTDPDHNANHEFGEMHLVRGAFRMDKYYCDNVEYARFDASAASYKWPAVPASDAAYPLRTYHSLALSGALADRYFQPIVGASTSNDMFFSRAAFVYQDNQRDLNFPGYADATVGDLLDAKGVPWAVYMGGLAEGCVGGDDYPFCVDPTDDPFSFSARKAAPRDLSQLFDDIDGGALPAVTFVRALGSQSEHPEIVGGGGKITDGENLFIKPILDAINGSAYAKNTLVLITWDEGGGWYDHVAPPMALADGCALPTTPVWTNGVQPSGQGNCGLIDSSTLPDGTVLPQTNDDPEYYSNSSNMNGQEYYGTRLPLIALGPFARKGAVSHAVMEHSSIVKFIEWNWLGHRSGQLGTRDSHVNNIGSMLDPRLKVPTGITD